MIPIRCRSNLDLITNEQFPVELPEVPKVGHLIESKVSWGGIRLRLKVVRVTWRYKKNLITSEEEWIPEVELGMPPPYSNLIEFYEWYGRITGRGKGAFI